MLNILSDHNCEGQAPVITIGNLRRITADRTYCEVCAEELAEILFDLDKVRGTPRLYIPGRAVER